ncbi:hypothetical protein BV25DRAFT_600558 [Artomyces pyxidatus]|uniref:Uncharacterized protein n=1 Tax=Artomyces pyxidatus TaxID=48021 RepID=A0ACB8T3I4_9AGAM|nr:hypothetical protein BV25DRAFT_600558 [Artomyces pyxidatus]
MVNWNDPGTVASNYASLVKLTHVFGGIYIWEFYTHLDFDWSIVSGKRPYRWTFWLYLNCRLSGILALITMFAGFDVTHKINCQAWVTFAFSLGYSAFACASALIVLRIMAIWERRRPIVALAVAVWIINIAFIIRSIIVTRGAWNAEGHFCEVLNTSMSKENIIVTTMTDIILLLLMFFGLLRWRSVSGGLVGGIWRLLYTQGIWWIVIVTVSEIPPCVLIILNLNDAFNLGHWSVPHISWPRRLQLD